jgi:hypothetical protein
MADPEALGGGPPEGVERRLSPVGERECSAMIRWEGFAVLGAKRVSTSAACVFSSATFAAGPTGDVLE